MARKPLYKKKTVIPINTNRRVNTISPGMVFGEWTTLGKGTKPDYINCECTCGTFREVHVYSLTSGKSESCGCMRKLKKQESLDARA